MSDTDDTDILLLIPPDYYMTSAQEKLEQEDRNRCQYKQLQRRLDAIENKRFKPYERQEAMLEVNTDASLVPETATTAAYRFLPPNKKAELNFINERLQSIQTANEVGGDDINRFTALSDVSTISGCTVRQHQIRNGVVHSTPKGATMPTVVESNRGDDRILLEIDNFLQNRQYSNSDWNDQSPNDCIKEYCSVNCNELQVRSQSDALNSIKIESMSQMQKTDIQPTVSSTKEHNLISLSEIWSKSGQNTAIDNAGMAATTTSMSLKEEQLRRQHLEKIVYSLQTRLLEYQQKISVAMEVDKQKDAALKSCKADQTILEEEVRKLRENLDKVEQDQRELNMQKDSIQRELSHALNLATKFEEKNERLESELSAITRKSNESNIMYKAQIEELEMKINVIKRTEESALNELTKMKDKLVKTEYQTEKLKIRSEEMEKDKSTLLHQKESLQDLHQKLKLRLNGLEMQKKSLQESVANLTETENTLKRKLEAQQKTLKVYYQQQLENVVANKLREFQEQLDKTEATLKSESRERERLIAERAVKQLELINEKNELEHNLLQEKHNEEVELYRIQLANASKKIEKIESKLITYKSKRADIAEKLHDVMETQWQRALEILTSPTNQSKSIDSKENSDTDALGHSDDTQAHFETPKAKKVLKPNFSQNNLNATRETNIDAEPEKPDRLQAYIELLLSKSPSDVDKLNEILALTRRSSAIDEKSTKNSKRNICCNSKPPWKA